MAERIDVPPILQGDEESQLRQLWSYLYQLSEAINNNLDAIGGNELTDAEMRSMQQILAAAGGGTDENIPSDYETLKSLVIKTADFVQSKLAEYRMSLLSESVASGQFGRYVRNTGLDVVVTPEGITQNYSFQEIVQDLKVYEVNAKNYIKTGLLRTVGSIPVYGVAIGKDVVTFSEDGEETYHDGNKVAELTADELSFWQNSVKIAGYTGNRISFYYNGNEVFYIQQGKLYAVGDVEITSGKKLILASNADLDVNSGGDINVNSGGDLNIKSGGGIEIQSGGDIAIKTGGTLTVDSNQFAIDASGNAAFRGTLYAAGGTFAGKVTASGMEMGGYDLKDANSKAGVYLREVEGSPLIGTFNNVLILNGFTTPNDVNYSNIFRLGYHAGIASGTYTPYIGNDNVKFDIADRTHPVFRAYMENIVPGSGSKVRIWLAGYDSDDGMNTRAIEFYRTNDENYIVSPVNPDGGDATGHVGTANDPMKDGYFDDLYVDGSRVITASGINGLLSDFYNGGSPINKRELHNCTATDTKNAVKGRVVNNRYLILSGRYRIIGITRTGAMPGVIFDLPSGWHIRASDSYYVGTNEYSDAGRFGESTYVSFTEFIEDNITNSTTFTVKVTETYANVIDGKDLIIHIPTIIIPIQLNRP